MSIDFISGVIKWHVHLESSPAAVYRLLATDDGRARFWAEESVEENGVIHFRFPNGTDCTALILHNDEPVRFVVNYFGNHVIFELTEDSSGGTDLTLTDYGGNGDDRVETHAGWVSVLMTLKAMADHGVDLRNHDPMRTWDAGYLDN